LVQLQGISGLHASVTEVGVPRDGELGSQVLDDAGGNSEPAVTVRLRGTTRLRSLRRCSHIAIPRSFARPAVEPTWMGPAAVFRRLFGTTTPSGTLLRIEPSVVSPTADAAVFPPRRLPVYRTRRAQRRWPNLRRQLPKLRQRPPRPGTSRVGWQSDQSGQRGRACARVGRRGRVRVPEAGRRNTPIAADIAATAVSQPPPGGSHQRLDESHAAFVLHGHTSSRHRNKCGRPPELVLPLLERLGSTLTPPSPAEVLPACRFCLAVASSQGHARPARQDRPRRWAETLACSWRRPDRHVHRHTEAGLDGQAAFLVRPQPSCLTESGGRNDDPRGLPRL
jgi:hypothetical protein